MRARGRLRFTPNNGCSAISNLQEGTLHDIFGAEIHGKSLVEKLMTEAAQARRMAEIKRLHEDGRARPLRDRTARASATTRNAGFCLNLGVVRISIIAE
jgi:hypothetical protein